MSLTSTVLYLHLFALALSGFSGTTAAAPTTKHATGAQRPAKQYPSFKACAWPQLDTAIQHFSNILQFQTVGNASHPDHADPVVWEPLDLWMHETYSNVLSTFEVEKDWTHPPFGGVVADGFVWGRGAMDVKVLIILLMEAASALLAEDFKPQRTIMFAFGHDEELSGAKGATMVAAELASRGVKLELVVDEGTSIVMDGLPPLYSSPVALIATVEKMYMQVEVTLSSNGGHSSMPPVDGSSIGDRLGRFLSAMSAAPGAIELVRPTSDLMAELGKLVPAGVSHIIGAARWLPPVRWLLAYIMTLVQAETAAMVRTTAAVTVLQAGTAANVLPQTATVGLNFRLLPGHSVETVRKQVEGWLGRDLPHATIKVDAESAASGPVADHQGPHFAIMKAALQQHWKLDQPGSPAVPVLPVLVPGVTDSRHYMSICPNGAVRFTPWTGRQSDRDYSRLHGVNERFRLSNFACALNSYKVMLRGFGLMAVDAGQNAAAAAEGGVISEL